MIRLLLPFFRNEKDMQPALSIRYSLYSIIAISASLLSAAELISAEHRKKLFYTVLSLALLYHLSANVFFLPEAVIRKEKLIEFIKDIKEEESDSNSLQTTGPSPEKQILKQAIENNYYQPDY